MFGPDMFGALGGLVNKALNGGGYCDDRAHYLLYNIDTSKPLEPVVIGGDADLWQRMQNMYYAKVTINREYKITGKEHEIYTDHYEMDVYCDRLLPYNQIDLVFRQAIGEVIGVANRVYGTITIYKRRNKFTPSPGMQLVKETPLMNIYQKI